MASHDKISHADTVMASLTLLHLERPKLYSILAFLGAMGLKGIYERFLSFGSI